MLEIEQQFSFDRNLLPKLKAKFSNFTQKTLDETYFDFSDFKLLKNDTWLRNRNGSFELKYRKPENRGQQLEIYSEFNSENEIKEFINIPPDINLKNWIQKNLKPIIEIQTTRYTFLTKNLIVDIDITNFGYAVCEIEFSGDATKDEAQKQILSLAKQIGLNDDLVKNKAKAFIELKYPALTAELKQLKVF